MFLRTNAKFKSGSVKQNVYMSNNPFACTKCIENMKTSTCIKSA